MGTTYSKRGVTCLKCQNLIRGKRFRLVYRDEVRRAVRHMAPECVDWIKIVATGAEHDACLQIASACQNRPQHRNQEYREGWIDACKRIAELIGGRERPGDFWSLPYAKDDCPP